MSEDSRIPEIRAVLDELPGIEPHEQDAAWRIADSRSKALQRIRAILDNAPPAPRVDDSLRDLVYDAMGRLGDWEKGVIQPSQFELDDYSHWRGVAGDVARAVTDAGWTKPRASEERAIPEPTEGTQA